MMLYQRRMFKHLFYINDKIEIFSVLHQYRSSHQNFYYFVTEHCYWNNVFPTKQMNNMFKLFRFKQSTRKVWHVNFVSQNDKVIYISTCASVCVRLTSENISFKSWIQMTEMACQNGHFIFFTRFWSWIKP